LTSGASPFGHVPGLSQASKSNSISFLETQHWQVWQQGEMQGAHAPAAQASLSSRSSLAAAAQCSSATWHHAKVAQEYT
jgi:hypothetical protein